MPGSYSMEAVLADAALETLKRAYKENELQKAHQLILEAYDSISRLKNSMIDAYDDPYELSESNSAV